MNIFSINCNQLTPCKVAGTYLYRIYGRPVLRCVQMKAISWDYFGSSFIMILKTVAYVFVWIGRFSSSMERHNAMKMANKFKDNMADVVIVDDGYEMSLPAEIKEIWNKFLPLNERTVESQLPSNSKTYPDSSNRLRIYKCCYRNNRLHVDQLDVPVPTRADLSDSSSVYVLDGYVHGVWLWVGMDVSQTDKVSAMGNGRAFIKKVINVI